MKNVLVQNSSAKNEDAEFLKKVQNQQLGFADLLMAAPARLLNASVEEVDFPARFTNRIRSNRAEKLVDLIPLHPENMVGKNFGARTLEVATEELKNYFVKKINQRPLVTLREMMQDFVNDLLAREGRIFEMRMGLQGERYTLEAVGRKYGLTRERVRQIEGALVRQFDKKYPAVQTIRMYAKEGTTLPAFILATDGLIAMSDVPLLIGILETLDPKMHLVAQTGLDPVISAAPQTDFVESLRKSLDVVEDLFRASNNPLTEERILNALRERKMDETSISTAMAKVRTEGRWVNGTLLSPNNDRTNLALGALQASAHPIHIDDVANTVRALTSEEQSTEALRASLSLVPSIRWFGSGRVGLVKHIPLNAEKISEIIAYCERVVQRGQEDYQWNTKDLLNKVLAHNPDVSLTHNELNVILQDSQKLAYLGRLTWMLKGEHDEKRTFYRDIFVAVLNKAGKPLAEDVLVERAKRHRGLHLNVHLRGEVEVLEVSPKVWGLTRRDHPFTKAEVKTITKAFDESYGSEFSDEYLDKLGINRKGIRASEIAKIVEVNS